MLIAFSLSNFLSFKDTQSISFQAGRITRHSSHFVDTGCKKILKSSLIYGANASGKSNLIKAIDFSKTLILGGIDNINLKKKHFRVESDMYRIPGFFEYDLWADGHEYAYGIVISYSDQCILSEWLSRIEPNGNETDIFYSEKGKAIDFNYDIIPEEGARVAVRPLIENFGPDKSKYYEKHTILTDLAMRFSGNINMFRDVCIVFEWFSRMSVIFPGTRCLNVNDVVSSDVEEKLSHIISSFDTGIKSVSAETSLLDFDKFEIPGISPDYMDSIKQKMSNAPEGASLMLVIGDSILRLFNDDKGSILYNRMLLDHGNSEDRFEFGDESDGTKRLFDLIPVFIDPTVPSTVIIDEIDRSLHSNLIKRFFEVFFELAEGKNMQLIATTHDSNLMDLDMFRQDEYWFVERENDQSSKIYSLYQFRERFDKKIDKEYLIGRYGAVPVFGEFANE